MVLIARTIDGLRAILIGDDPAELQRDLRHRLPNAAIAEMGDAPDSLADDVAGLLESPWMPLDIPLDVSGTAFQRIVWNELRMIPSGSTATYAQIARQIGRPRAVRAVAQACAANPLVVVVPCHRVLRSDGGISGYRWGVQRKKELLARESAAIR